MQIRALDLKAGVRIEIISPASQHLQVLFKGSGEKEPFLEGGDAPFPKVDT